VEEEAGGRGHVGRGEAEAVVAGVGGGEDEFAAAFGALGDDAVVVVEGFVDGYEDALVDLLDLWWGCGWMVVGEGLAYHVRIRHVGLCLLVPLCCCEVACISIIIVLWYSQVVRSLHTNDKRVLWQLLEEALLGGPVDVEVQGLCLAGQQCQTGY